MISPLPTSRIGSVVMLVGMIVYNYRLILREEAGIRAEQGEIYRAYCAAVPRLWPALHPKLPSAGAIPNWSGGFLGEAFMWVMAFSVAAFAVTLKLPVFFVVLGSAYVVYFVCGAIIRKRQTKTPADAEPSGTERPPKGIGQSNSSL